ncbi:MAG: PIN domain-containing protein [Acutalibacteraceae bacterium]|nr:PIN domain-containing protein [Acutalibacteraceae bacterium]
MGSDAALYTMMQNPDFLDWVERYNGKFDFDEYDEFTEREDIVFERYFLIDYENVNRDGLAGVTKLKKQDCVRIYYSASAETLTFGLHRRINASNAHFDYIKVQIPIKNAVDCQILFDIRDLAKENRMAEYFIISRDSDFDAAIKNFESRNLKVKKIEKICELSTSKNDIVKKANSNQSIVAVSKSSPFAQNSDREAQIRAFFERHYKKNKYSEHKESIIELLINAKTKKDINNGLLKYFDSSIVNDMMSRLSLLIKDLPQDTTPTPSTSNTREAQARALFEHRFKKKIYAERKKELIGLIVNAKTKADVSNGLLKYFDSNTAGGMFANLLPLINDLPADNADTDNTASPVTDISDEDVRAFMEQRFKKKIYVEIREELIDLLVNAQTKADVSNGLLKYFDSNTVGGMLGTLQPLIRDLPEK